MEENKSAQFFLVNGLVLSFAVVFATFFFIEKTGTFMSSINSLPDGRLEMKKGLRNQSTKDQGIILFGKSAILLFLFTVIYIYRNIQNYAFTSTEN